MKKILNIFFIICIISLIAGSIHAYENFDGRYNYNRYNEGYSIDKLSDSGTEVLFIVDFSGSMNEKIGYTPKVYLAIDAIQSIVKQAEPTAKIGLRIFGVKKNNNQGSTNQKSIDEIRSGICTASKLILPISTHSADEFSDKLSYINPQGATPIGYSLRQAVQNDFTNANSLKHIILLTDGGENCGDDPCRFITNLMRTRKDIKIDVIGITIDDNAYSQLNCIASASHGQYYSVETEQDFKIKLKQAFNSVPTKTVMNTNTTTNNIITMPKPKINNDIKYKTYGFQFEL